MDIDEIHDKFMQDWGEASMGEYVFNDLLVPMYKGRAYHNLEHVVRCRDELATFWATATRATGRSSPEHIMLAVWFHDIVYDPFRQDNEESSAGVAELAMLGGGKSTVDDRSRVQRLILATKHEGTPEREDEQIIRDVDISILGADPEEYRRYSEGVATEYSRTNITPRQYVLGRASFLEGLRGPIFYTRYFREKYNDRARENIRAELHKLYTILDPESNRACQYHELISSSGE